MAKRVQGWLDLTRQVDFLGPLALRLYLVPIFWMAGTNKLNHFSDTVAWFGGPVAEGGLGLPLPTLMAGLAVGAEVLGALCLLLGLGVRWMAIPLMVTMLVAIFAVHWPQGWYAVASANAADPLSSAQAVEAASRLKGFMEWLQEAYPGRYAYITEHGRPVILNNGIEFATTYLVMLLTLFFVGSGKYLSVDYWLRRRLESDRCAT